MNENKARIWNFTVRRGIKALTFAGVGYVKIDASDAEMGVRYSLPIHCAVHAFSVVDCRCKIKGEGINIKEDKMLLVSGQRGVLICLLCLMQHKWIAMVTSLLF